MENDFVDVMKKCSNVELLKIITELRKEYQEQAVIAAEQEYSRRNLSNEQVENLKKEIILEKEMLENGSRKPLSLGWKLILLLFPGIAALIFSSIFKEMGFDRISKEIVKWTLYGFLIYIIGFLLLLGMVYVFF